MNEHLPPRQQYLPVVYIRPRSAAALVPVDEDPGTEVVEHLRQLVRRVLS